MRILRHWRLIILAALLGAPILILIGFGLYALWGSVLGYVMGWFLAGSLALACFLGWRWQRQNRLLRLDFTAPLHWTDRDRQAWRLVEARAREVAKLTSRELTNLQFYVDSAQSMALELARFYHPGAKDPVGSLTIPEILAVVELAARDLAEMVDEFLPGGHLLTINDMRRVKQIADWYPVANRVTWIVSSIFSPVNTAFRFLASQAGMSRPWQLLQDNVLVWFAAAYLHRLGSYLIDLNSGRLRVGAKRYLELQRTAGSAAPADSEADPADLVRTVTFAVIGQAKVGKSSLINALLGERRAVTDVTPATAAIERYDLHPPDLETHFQLLDTVGYSNAGPREDQRRATEEAARQADVILLVLHARNPARQADLEILNELERFFERHPELHDPPILAVLTHVDLLSPAMEWAPPYDWQKPAGKKEEQINDAVATVREQFGGRLAGVVPICSAAGKTYGVQEWVLPALVGLLDQAHAVAMLRCLRVEADRGKVQKIFAQLLAVGKTLATTFLKPPPKRPPGNGRA